MLPDPSQYFISYCLEDFPSQDMGRYGLLYVKILWNIRDMGKIRWFFAREWQIWFQARNYAVLTSVVRNTMFKLSFISALLNPHSFPRQFSGRRFLNPIVNKNLLWRNYRDVKTLVGTSHPPLTHPRLALRIDDRKQLRPIKSALSTDGG